MPHQGVPAIVAIGDSHTYNNVYGLTLQQFYPHRLAAALEADGADLTPFNYGVSGETTTQILARVPAIAAQGSPELAIIYGGSNDSAAINTSQNLINISKGLAADHTIIVGNHYANISNSNDTLSAQWATWRRLRLKQRRAAYLDGAIYIDAYRYMRQLIVDTPSIEGQDTYWHVATGNRHLNVTGEQILADAIYRKVKSLGWAEN